MKQLLMFLFLLCSVSASAQDVIVKKDGSTILSKVLEVGQNEIKYKKYDNLEGPTYTINKSELQAINYQNGAKDTFSDSVREENRYLPNNQNDGVQQYNDRALLMLDNNISKPLVKAKKKRMMAWIGGAILVGLSIPCFALSGGSDDHKDDDSDSTAKVVGGCVFLAGGIAWTTAFLISAHKYEKEADMLQASSIYQHSIPLSDSSSLSLGADLLSDRSLGTNTIGLGLRYNF